MWQEEHTWLHYIKDIMATDVPSAVFLVSFMRHSSINKSYAAALEVVDLQKYKVIRKEQKVRIALKNRRDVPFVFFVGKN